jgi:hypothetical protein
MRRLRLLCPLLRLHILLTLVANSIQLVFRDIDR